MPQFVVNPHRIDPYKGFKFRVMWDGRHVAGVSRVSPLRRVTAVVEHREGSDVNTVRKSPGLTAFDAVTLERGVTHDTEFEDWADKVWRAGAGPGGEMSLADFRKDVAIELYNEAGQLVHRYMLYRCWVAEYQALSQLDAESGAVAIEAITIVFEGWERDRDVNEPVEPKLD